MTGFRYRLAPLLRYRQSLLQPLRQALQDAEDALDAARAALRMAELDAADCERALSALPSNQPLYWSALRYVRERRLHGLALADEVAAKQRERDFALEAAQNGRTALRQVEKHRDRQRREAEARAQRRDYREQDDAWLQRRARAGMT